MDLAERLADVERRLAVLERADSAARSAPEPTDSDFWALEGLKAKLAEGEVAAGGVLFTGAVRLPTNERYEWQYGQVAETLLDEDWSDAAESLAALGQPVRMRLLREILRGCRTVADLAAVEGVGTTGQIYHHLRQLTAAGWLRTGGRGRYEVPPGRVIPLLVVLAAARP
ncbi:ArsR/SmtB family transcription factor [Rhizomonospora bruguierae]|uniref:ArsR/SmtB family transcription factor n=1 Tax=Rhizomonospora bruguierae TaxID=1581705 RepID=UPI001BCE430F|nr:winged helix-turn-helix domain-containing protein [Micromonospora sp. NBRC 107566]